MNDQTRKLDAGDSSDISTDETVVSSPDFEHSGTLVGQRLDGRFLIESDLTTSGADAGGLGLVYLAQDTKLMGRRVVVKILKKTALQNEEVIRKFKHEREALIRLDHPNIVRILDLGTLSDGNPFVVMEYISGYSLRRKLNENGPLPFDLIAHITESVTAALGSAHEQKILHRDIKPENVMLAPQGDGFEHVKLIDFGIARVEESQLAPVTTVGQPMGTINYIAPEQLMGHLDQSPGADVYSFSIVVYEMLTGKLPFEPQSVVEMYELQRQNSPTPPSSLRTGIPEKVDSLLLAGLEYDVVRRPLEARKFGRELAAALREARAPQATVPAQHVPAATIAAAQPSEPTLEREEHFVAPPALNLPKQAARKSSKTYLRVATALVILAAIAIPAGIIYWNSGSPDLRSTTPDATANERKMTYSLSVQKMRDGKPFEAPFDSTGQEIFEDGYKFKLRLTADADGFVYIFNEGKRGDGTVGHFILYPTPKTNSGSAAVQKDKQIETGNNTFGGGRGKEIVWLIWTREENADLESIRSGSFSTAGEVVAKNADDLRSFLDKHKDQKVNVTTDQQKTETNIQAVGDVVVHRLELQHR